MNINASSFNVLNEYSSNGISYVLSKYYEPSKKPVIVCIGSDLVLGDSLGPLVGTFLKDKSVDAFIYGSLSSPVTAKEIPLIKNYLKKAHPKSFVIAIDAAVGEIEDVGLIKTYKDGLRPGLGVDKKLGKIGDCSIIGIVAPKSEKNHELFNLTRLNLVYKMAKRIADGLEEYFTQNACERKRKLLS